MFVISRELETEVSNSQISTKVYISLQLAIDRDFITMATTKNLINSLNNVVPEALSGLCYTYPQLIHHTSYGVILSPDYKYRKDKVSLVCGGGSGHEPFAAGFVGSGMLTASIAGSIFAAPPSDRILHAFKCIAHKNKAGILVIIPNYTGDCLNFGIAIEKAKLAEIMVREVIVGDDCSIPTEERSVAGRRGLVGMLFVIKIASALAETGASLDEVAELATYVSQHIATYGIGLSACVIPSEGLMFELAQDEIECGMGVHGEVGYERMKLRTASEVVTLMLQRICEDLFLTANDSIAVIVNNFGALSQLEQAIVVYEVVNQFKNLDITPIRVYSGVLMTSLNSAGIHVSVLKLTGKHMFTLITYLDAETMAPCWPGCSYTIPSSLMRTPFREDELGETQTCSDSIVKTNLNSYMSYNYDKIYDVSLFNNCLHAVSHVFTDNNTRNYLNELDRGCGDGDCGDTMYTFGNKLITYFESPCKHPQSALFRLANIMSHSVGGTTGALYCLFFTAGAKVLPLLASDSKNLDTQSVWFYVFCDGLDCLKKYGKVKAGDRSMIDTLEAVRTIYEKLLHERSKQINPTDFYDKIIKTAWEGCNSTKNMIPKVGRASYTKQVQYLIKEDAGAYAAAVWIEAVAQTIRKALYPCFPSLETMSLDDSNSKRDI